MLLIPWSVPEEHVSALWKNITDYFLQADCVNVSNPDSVQGFIDVKLFIFTVSNTLVISSIIAL